MKTTDAGKEVVFRGTRTQCEDFVRANRFSVLLTGMEMKAEVDGGGFLTGKQEIWAWRTSPISESEG